MSNKKEIKCFGHTLYKFRCHETIYKNKILNNAINELLESDYAKNHNYHEGVGNTFTTCGGEVSILDYSDETLELTNWIKDKIISIGRVENLKRKDIQFTRNWVNKMSFGSSGEVHTHSEHDGDAVAIFYLKNSEYGSKLVIVNDSKKNCKNYFDYDSSDLRLIDTNEGDLVIHDINVTHAVSEHKSKEPRICLIFEFKIL